MIEDLREQRVYGNRRVNPHLMLVAPTTVIGTVGDRPNHAMIGRARLMLMTSIRYLECPEIVLLSRSYRLPRTSPLRALVLR